MNYLILLIYLTYHILLTSSPLLAKTSMFGPFTMEITAIQVNGGQGHRLVRNPIDVIIENTVTGQKYFTNGIRPTIEVPPGHYTLSGSNRFCKLQDRVLEVFSHRRIKLAAICS